MFGHDTITIQIIFNGFGKAIILRIDARTIAESTAFAVGNGFIFGSRQMLQLNGQNTIAA